MDVVQDNNVCVIKYKRGFDALSRSLFLQLSCTHTLTSTILNLKIIIKIHSKEGDIMKMRKFALNKLWRDKTPGNMEKAGSIIHVTHLDDAQYSNELGLKLIEEAHEVHIAPSNDELLSELADVLEVIDCIIKFNNLSRVDLIARQEEKRNYRGSFLERKFVTVA